MDYLIFSIDEPTGSSCSSNIGLCNELARKCTLSADSLLFHQRKYHQMKSDESGASGASGDSCGDYYGDYKSPISPTSLTMPKIICHQRRISGSKSSEEIYHRSEVSQT